MTETYNKQMQARIDDLTPLGDSGLVLSGWNPSPGGGGSFTISDLDAGGHTVGNAFGATAAEAGEQVASIVTTLVENRQAAADAAAEANKQHVEDVAAVRRRAVAAYAKTTKEKPPPAGAGGGGED